VSSGSASKTLGAGFFLQVLGSPGLKQGGQELSFKTRKSLALLVYLAVRRDSVSRAELDTLLWPEQDDEGARRSLRGELFRLAQVVGRETVIEDSRGLRINAEALETDLWGFEALAEQGDPQALEHYRGRLLEGFHIRDAEPFESWLQAERERVQERFLELLKRLAELAEAKGNPSQGQEYLQRAIAANPLDETLYHRIIRLHGLSRDRVGALRWFERLKRVLEEELGVEPSPEVQVLLDSVNEGRVLVKPSASPRAVSGFVPPALPLPAGPLIGRTAELEQLQTLLQQPSVRLITLLGPGGVGKTRLMIELAQLAQPESSKTAVVFVELAPLHERGLVAGAIAHSLGLKEDGRPVLERLIAHLQDAAVLLLLDNFEQVMEAAGLVGELLANCPRLQVVVTSRSPLRLRGERELAIGPLATPSALEPLPTLAGSAAIQLFVERAKAVRPGFSLTAENASAVAQVCARLDGLPLALELAAARSRALGPQAMLGLLDNRLAFLSGGPRDAPERQRSLRNAIEWSHTLLGPDEQRLFAALSVFVGGFDAEAVQTLSEQLGQSRGGLEALERLIEQSLIRAEEANPQTPSESPRFSMLQTIREYAAERLRARDEEKQLREIHARYYLELVEQAWQAQHVGPQQRRWLNRLEAERDNLRAALNVWIDDGQAEQAQRMAVGLRFLWDMRGYFAEGRAAFKTVLQLPADVNPSTRAAALTGAGVLAWRQGDYAEAGPLLEEGLRLRRTIQDQDGIAYSLQSLGNLAARTGNLKAARQYQQENLALRRTLQDRSVLGDAVFSLGNVALLEGNLLEARELYDEALTLYRELGEHTSLPFVLINLGEVARFQGKYPEAQKRAQEGLEHARSLGDRMRMANAMQSLGLTALDQGEVSAARSWLDQALSIYQALGERARMGLVQAELGNVQLRLGELEAAEQLFRESLSLERVLGIKPAMVAALRGLSQIRALEGNLTEAKARLTEGFKLALEVSDQPTIIRYIESAGILAFKLHQPEHAVRWLSTDQALRERSGYPQRPYMARVIHETLAGLKDKLGEARFQELWETGKRIGTETIYENLSSL
jgi:predicted ATPase/DNA-binding SARP family transcriptional activator